MSRTAVDAWPEPRGPRLCSQGSPDGSPNVGSMTGVVSAANWIIPTSYKRQYYICRIISYHISNSLNWEAREFKEANRVFRALKPWCQAPSRFKRGACMHHSEGEEQPFVPLLSHSPSAFDDFSGKSYEWIECTSLRSRGRRGIWRPCRVRRGRSVSKLSRPPCSKGGLRRRPADFIPVTAALEGAGRMLGRSLITATPSQLSRGSASICAVVSV